MKNGLEVAEALAGVLDTVPGLRAYPFMPDTFTPPGVVVGQPDIDFSEAGPRTFHAVSWDYPCSLVVARSSSRQAQLDLYGYLDKIVHSIDGDPELGGVANMARVRDARPQTVSANGAERPGYLISVSVLA